LVAAAASALAGYSFFIEPRWLRVRERELYLSNLPVALDGARVAHLSDLHLSDECPTSVVLKAIDVTLKRKPDIVAVTGDITQHGAESALAARVLGRLTTLPTVAILGNHDYHSGAAAADRLVDALTSAGVTVLRDRSEVFAVRGQPVRVVGLDLAKRGRPPTLRSVVDMLDDESTPRLLLAHSPSALGDLRQGDALIALVGHTHGGQVFVPVLTWAYIRAYYGGLGDGLRVRNGVPVHVSRGLATAKVAARFLRRPEVTFLTLRREREGARG